MIKMSDNRKLINDKPIPTCKLCRGFGFYYEKNEAWGIPCSQEIICDCYLDNPKNYEKISTKIKKTIDIYPYPWYY